MAEPDNRRGERPSVGRNVTICLDGSSLGERAIPHAIAVARALGASVTMLRVLEGASAGIGPADPLRWESHRREARDYTGRLAARFQKDDTLVEAAVVDGGRAADEICRWCASRHVDLTAATTHGEGGQSPWSISGTARKLLDRAPGSILIVPAALAQCEEVPRYRHILVPLDGSQHAETAVPIAERLAIANGAELLLAHVVRDIALTRIGPPEEEDAELVARARRRNERVAQQYLDRLRARLRTTACAVRIAILRGDDVGGRLAALVRAEGIDLVVMADAGTPAGRDYDGLALNLIARSVAPLLLVRPQPSKSMWRAAQPERAARLPISAAS